MTLSHHRLLACVAMVVFVLACSHRKPTEDDYAAGERYIHERLERARAGDVDWGLVNGLQSLTEQKFAAQEYRAAMHTMEPLAEFMEIIYGPNSLEYARAQMDLCEIYSRLEEWPKCESALRRALAIFEAHPEATAGQRIGARVSLGSALFVQERYVDAEQLLVQTLEECEHEFDGPSFEEAVASRLLADVRTRQGRTEDADRLLKRANAIEAQLTAN